MRKLIIIGCPASGKSTLARRINAVLNYPMLHLDKIYHIDNFNRISSEELLQRIYEFDKVNEKWIIDGNYKSSLEERVKLCDTVILLTLDTKTCLLNAHSRSKQATRSDMAAAFDNSLLNEQFLNFIENFNKETLPDILNVLKKYEDSKKIIILKSYSEIDEFASNIKNYIE